MKSIAAGTTSGCLLWIVAFFVLALCLCPVAAFVGGFSTTLTADAVAGVLEPYLCPEGSRAEIITFQTTSRDEFGNEQPATGYEMQCVNADGTVVREPSPDYAFYWVGLLALGSLVVSAVLAIFLAAPIGGLVTHLVQRRRKASAA